MYRMDKQAGYSPQSHQESETEHKHCIAQGTMFNILWQIIIEKNMKKNMCVWQTLRCDGEALYSQQNKTGNWRGWAELSGSDHKLLIAKFRLKESRENH